MLQFQRNNYVLNSSGMQYYSNNEQNAQESDFRHPEMKVVYFQDPYGLVIKRGPGTRECPILIPSAFSARIVGCECSDGCFNINWMWLHKEEPKRCGCGFWFQLVEKDPI